MRVIIGYGTGVDSQQMRQIALGAGLDCSAEDLVPMAELDVRLAQAGADLILAAVGTDQNQALSVIERVAGLTKSPILAVGSPEDPQLVKKVKRVGARDLLDAGDLRTELDAELEKLADTRSVPGERGLVVSIFAPTPGSGSTTVAGNLAGSFALAYPNEAALVELSRYQNDVAMLLNIKPKFTLLDVCLRWERLDKEGIVGSMTAHSAGLQVLPNQESLEPAALVLQAIKRIAVLARVTFKATVLELDRNLDAVQIEAMKLSDVVGLVVRPDVTCVKRAGQALQEAVSRGVPKDRFRLIVNRWGQPGQLRLSQIEENIGLKAVIKIPDDPKRINSALNRGLLLQEYSRRATIARAFSDLASQLNGKGK